MSITPATRPAATGSANPLHINLSAPPVGTRTTITLERNTATSGVAVTTESTLISDIQEETPGIIGCCMGYVKRTWASICNWFLYVFHFFFPPSALSAITQVEQNLERSHHEQRRWMEERQAEIMTMLGRGRPAEPPVGGTTATTLESTTAPVSVMPRPTMESLLMGASQRARLLAAFTKLHEMKASVDAVVDTQFGTGTGWRDAAAFKQDYRATLENATTYLRQLDDLSRYSQEGVIDKAGTHTGVSDVPDISGVEAHTRNIARVIDPPSYTPSGSDSSTPNPTDTGNHQ